VHNGLFASVRGRFEALCTFTYDASTAAVLGPGQLAGPGSWLALRHPFRCLGRPFGMTHPGTSYETGLIPTRVDDVPANVIPTDTHDDQHA
jgi:hypothetical protein